MESKVIESKQKSEFPLLMEGQGVIAICRGDYTATIVSAPNPAIIGDVIRWNKHQFTPFRGEVILKN